MDYNEFQNAMNRLGYNLPSTLMMSIFNNLDYNNERRVLFDDFIRVCSIMQIVKVKMAQLDPVHTGRITIDMNQLIDIIFTIPM